LLTRLLSSGWAAARRIPQRGITDHSQLVTKDLAEQRSRSSGRYAWGGEPKLLAVDLTWMANRRPRLMFTRSLIGRMGLA
jgi:hypothetical protein